MNQTSSTPHDQIALVESRVHLEKLQMKAAVQGLRFSVRDIVSGPGGLVGVFLAAAIVGAIGGRKLASRRHGVDSRR